MADFDFAWDFREHAPYVTDPSYACAELNASYPTTYTNGDGLSINGGWTVVGSHGGVDKAVGNDPRIAGINYINPSITRTFRADLASGSGPGAGTYAVDLAVGAPDAGWAADIDLKDDTVSLIAFSTTFAAGHYIDATGADVAATTNWTGAAAVKTFTSTTCNLAVNATPVATYVEIAHFRLTKQAGAATSLRRLSVRGA